MQSCGCGAAGVSSLGSLIVQAHTDWATGILRRGIQMCRISWECDGLWLTYCTCRLGSSEHGLCPHCTQVLSCGKQKVQALGSDDLKGRISTICIWLPDSLVAAQRPLQSAMREQLLLLVIQTICLSEWTNSTLQVHLSFLHKEPMQMARHQTLRRQKLGDWNSTPSRITSMTSLQTSRSSFSFS